jgi:hypothetical protein
MIVGVFIMKKRYKVRFGVEGRAGLIAVEEKWVVFTKET